MSFIQSVKTCLRKFFDYNGRAVRSEYWYFILFTWLIIFILTSLEALLVFTLSNDPYSWIMISDFLWLIFVFPSINALTRRLHDVNRSGWWQLLYLTGIGVIVLLWWARKKGVDENNRYN